MVGAAGLHSSLEDLQERWAKIEAIILIFLGIDTVVAVLFGFYLLSRRLIEPIRNMVRKVDALAEGKYKPGKLVLDYSNEIGQLEGAFESMAVRLLRSKERLEENIISLEEAQEQLIRSRKNGFRGTVGRGIGSRTGKPIGFRHGASFIC